MRDEEVVITAKQTDTRREPPQNERDGEKKGVLVENVQILEMLHHRGIQNVCKCTHSNGHNTVMLLPARKTKLPCSQAIL